MTTEPTATEETELQLLVRVWSEKQPTSPEQGVLAEIAREARDLFAERDALQDRFDYAEQLLICLSENAMPESTRAKARAFEIGRTTMDAIDTFLAGGASKQVPGPGDKS